jgi:hypothetical protein
MQDSKRKAPLAAAAHTHSAALTATVAFYCPVLGSAVRLPFESIHTSMVSPDFASGGVGTSPERRVPSGAVQCADA